MAACNSTHLTDEDVEAVSRRMELAAHALLTIREMAFIAESEESNTESVGLLLRGIAMLARAEFKGLDACIEKLRDAPGIGGFATEFDTQ